jgi:hypothetical protein
MQFIVVSYFSKKVIKSIHAGRVYGNFPLLCSCQVVDSRAASDKVDVLMCFGVILPGIKSIYNDGGSQL